MNNEEYMSSAALCEKCPYSEFFWSASSPNAGKYGSEKPRIQTPFTQRYSGDYLCEISIAVTG